MAATEGVQTVIGLTEFRATRRRAGEPHPPPPPPPPPNGGPPDAGPG